MFIQNCKIHDLRSNKLLCYECLEGYVVNFDGKICVFVEKKIDTCKQDFGELLDGDNNTSIKSTFAEFEGCRKFSNNPFCLEKKLIKKVIHAPNFRIQHQIICVKKIYKCLECLPGYFSFDDKD